MFEVREKEEGVTGVCRFLATVSLSSGLSLLQICYAVQAMPPFTQSYCCVVAMFRSVSIYLRKLYAVLDLLEDDVSVLESVLNRISSLSSST